MRWIVLLGLVACGGASVDDGAATQTGGYALGDCSVTCERVKGQLARDFAVPQPIDCWEWALYSASSAQACDCVFRSKWAVQLSSGPTSCP